MLTGGLRRVGAHDRMDRKVKPEIAPARIDVAFDNVDAGSAGLSRMRNGSKGCYGAARTIASVVKKSRSTLPMLMYQHSCSGVF